MFQIQLCNTLQHIILYNISYLHPHFQFHPVSSQSNYAYEDEDLFNRHLIQNTHTKGGLILLSTVDSNSLYWTLQIVLISLSVMGINNI